MAPIPEENTEPMKSRVQIATEKAISKFAVPECTLNRENRD